MLVRGNDENTKTNTDGIVVDENLKAGKDTNAESLKREQEAINIDGLSVKEMNDLTEKVSATKFPSNTIFIHEIHENSRS